MQKTESNPYLLSHRKRLLDISIAVAGLAVCLFVAPLAMMAVCATSSGGPLYLGKRVGLNGRKFTAFKIRTMYRGADKDKYLFATPTDKRITPVGRFLRATYIDELPQFVNVLKGDMSVVGPRPETEPLTKRQSEINPDFKKRLVAKPGITGYSQTIMPHAYDVEMAAKRISHDIEYIKKASIGMDLGIVAKTIVRVVKRGGH